MPLCLLLWDAMEKIKENPILKFNDNYLQNVRAALGYEDVNKLKQDIQHFRDWIQKQNHFTVKEFDITYLERWLIYNKGSIERTKQKFDALCTYTNLMPDFLRNFDIKNEFRAVQTVMYNCVLPQPTVDNYRIIFVQLTGKDDKDYELLHFYRYTILIIHYMLFNDYCLGYEWIGDLRQMTMGFVSKMNPFIIHKGLNLIVEALAQRIKKIHLISGSKVFDTALTLIKQGLTLKLRERIIVHPNIESLYEHFPREQLPKEYGGEEKSIRELSDAVYKELCSDDNIARVKFMEKIGTDESNRLSSKFNEEYSGTPGSFKTMCVD